MKTLTKVLLAGGGALVVAAVAGGDDGPAKVTAGVPSPDPPPGAPTVSTILAPPTTRAGALTALQLPQTAPLIYEARQDLKVPRGDTYKPWPVYKTPEPLNFAAPSVAVRVWISSDWNPSTDSPSYYAGQWSFSGSSAPGTVLKPVLVHAPVSTLGVMTWLVVVARVLIDRRIEVRATYPGNGHTGVMRGRRYDMVFTIVPVNQQS